MPPIAQGASKSEWLRQLQALAAAYRKQKAAEASMAAQREETRKAIQKERRKTDKIADEFAEKVQKGTKEAEKLKTDKNATIARRAALKREIPARHGDADARAMEQVQRKRQAARERM